MACSYLTRNMFSILPLLVLLSVTPLASSFSPTDKITEALLYQLCSTPSLYRHFCVAWLNSDPKTFTVDLHGLLGMVIEKTVSLGYNNLEVMKGLARTTNDPNLKKLYGPCMISYVVSIKDLEEAKGLASSGKYMSASDAAFKAFISISYCQALLRGERIPANVWRRTIYFQRMCNTGNIFAYLLKS